MPSKGREWRTGRGIGKSSATYQLVRSSSEHPSSSWWKVYPAAFVSFLLPWLHNTNNGILKEKLFISASSSSWWGRLGGRGRTGHYITVVVRKQKEARKWKPGQETAVVQTAWVRVLGWWIGISTEKWTVWPPDEFHTSRQAWIAPTVFIYTSEQARFSLLTSKFFPSSYINLWQKRICQMCSLPTFTSKPL